MSDRYIKHPQTNQTRHVSDAYYDHGYEEYHISLDNKYHPKGHRTNEYITIRPDGQISCHGNSSKRTSSVSAKIAGIIFSSL